MDAFESHWLTLHTAVGLSSSAPAPSCMWLKNTQPYGVYSGVYWLQYSDGVPVQVYCKQTPCVWSLVADGAGDQTSYSGGWELIMKMAPGNTFVYSCKL